MDAAFETFYNSEWLHLDDYFRVHRARFIQTWDFMQKIGLPATGTALDVGGVGPLGSYLRRLGWIVEETKSDLRAPLGHAGDVFDVIICTETIEHIKDTDSSNISDLESFQFSGMSNLLSELRRVVVDSGKIFISTPNANSYITLHKWLNGESLLMDPKHVRELSVSDVRRLASNACLNIMKLDVVDSWPDFGGSVSDLKVALRSFLKFDNVERGDNIFAALNRAIAASQLP